MTNRTMGEGPNPSGLCMCGCGGKTPIASASSALAGNIAGCPKRYILNHHGKLLTVAHLVDSDTGCWVWQRRIVNGYGQTDVDRVPRPAHRVYYERYVGPIPAGTQLHHVCYNRACVNPSHMQPVLATEHMMLHRMLRLDTRLS